MRKRGISAEQAIAAAKNSRGIVSVIARRLNVSRAHVYNLIQKYPTFKSAIDEERENLDDSVESTIVSEMLGGWREDPETGQRVYVRPNSKLLTLWAKTRMKSRGFVERIEHTTPEDMPFAVSISEIEQVLEMVEKRRRELLSNYRELEDD